MKIMQKIKLFSSSPGGIKQWNSPGGSIKQWKRDNFAKKVSKKVSNFFSLIFRDNFIKNQI